MGGNTAKKEGGRGAAKECKAPGEAGEISYRREIERDKEMKKIKMKIEEVGLRRRENEWKAEEG